jgi:hypothetical protein
LTDKWQASNAEREYMNTEVNKQNQGCRGMDRNSTNKNCMAQSKKHYQLYAIWQGETAPTANMERSGSTGGPSRTVVVPRIVNRIWQHGRTEQDSGCP